MASGPGWRSRSVPRRRRSAPGPVRGHLEAIAAAAKQMTRPSIAMPLDYEDERTPGYRGVILFYYDKCIGCSLCAQICPSRAIKMYRVPGDKRIRPGYDLGRCIFCGFCVDICPVDALEESIVHDKVYGDIPSMNMDPVEWANWSLDVLQHQAEPRKRVRTIIDPERGLRYEVVEEGVEPRRR